jgi:hypothetical protein
VEGVIGSIETETSSGLKFLVHGVVKRRNGAVIVWGRCVDDFPTGRTFGASTLGAYCANVYKN